MKINLKEKSFILTINCLYLLILFFLKNSVTIINTIEHLKYISVFAIITYIIIFVSSYKLDRRMNLYHLFILLSFFYFYGQHLLLLIGSNYKELYMFNGILKEEIIIEASYFILFSILCLNIGYILVRKNLIVTKGNFENKRFYDFCLIVFFVCLGPWLYTVINSIYVTIVYGYGERVLGDEYAVSGIQNIPRIISSFMAPALLGLQISSKKENKTFFFLTFVYLVLYYLTGSRANATLVFIVSVYIEFAFKRDVKIDFSMIVKSIPLILFMVIIYSMVSMTRTSEFSNYSFIELLLTSISLSPEKNAVFRVLRETGFTFNVITFVIQSCPSIVEPIKGLSYISGIAYVLPNFMTNNFYITVNADTDSVFGQLYMDQQSGIGSSFIAEGYYNFAGSSLLLFVFFGMLFAFLINKTFKAVNYGNTTLFFLCIQATRIILFYIRSDTRTFLRGYVWFALSLVIIYKLFFNYRRTTSAVYPYQIGTNV